MGRYNSNKLSSKYVQDYMKNRLWERDKDQYVPLLNVRSLGSKGKSNRILGWKTGREHHFLSKLEYAAFYYFEWSEEVIDIKEQYPLLPIEQLQNIALETRIKYPNFKGEDIIMTTDFLITTREKGKINYYARTLSKWSNKTPNRFINFFPQTTLRISFNIEYCTVFDII